MVWLGAVVSVDNSLEISRVNSIVKPGEGERGRGGEGERERERERGKGKGERERGSGEHLPDYPSLSSPRCFNLHIQ